MKYRKKPVEIEAMQWDGSMESRNHTLGWIGAHGGEARYRSDDKALPGPGRGLTRIADRLEIDTLEGTMYALPGDWIIRGVQGEFYPCKPDIFEATYEPVGEAS